MPNQVFETVAPPSAETKATTPAARRVFFPNLNGLRFFAVLMVLLNHFEENRAYAALPNLMDRPAVQAIGQLGVTLFFVLSGFLITYLLLVEKEELGEVKFGAFYLRRVLRIWPLYYAVVLLSLFVLPHLSFFSPPSALPQLHEHFAAKVVLYALILPNVAKELFPVIAYLGQAWSIGVEEQFYIIWPVLIYFSRHYLRNFLLLAGFMLLACKASWFLTTPQRHMLPINEVTDFIKNFLFFFRIQCMAIGGVFAFLLFQNKPVMLRVLTARSTQVVVWAGLALLLVKGQYFPYINHELYSVLFGLMVFNLALTDTSIISLRHPVLDYLGRISYGLYMLHLIAITVVVKTVDLVWPSESVLRHVTTFGAAVAVSVVLAGLSYRYLEAPFLQLKKRFARIHSGS